MNICIIPKCNNKVYARGLCQKHYNKIKNQVKKRIKRKDLKPRKCKICGREIDVLDHSKALYCKLHRGFTESTRKRYIENTRKAEKAMSWKHSRTQSIIEKYKNKDKKGDTKSEENINFLWKTKM